MARRPFDPLFKGWKKVSYRRGDILDRDAVSELVADADVVVHLAFIILAGSEESREINLTGSRNVFEAAVAAKAKRIVYTSSVAAYGFHPGSPELLTEDVAVHGSERHPYSAQKAEVEAELAKALADSNTDAYVFRPCIVAGPEAQLLINSIPLVSVLDNLPGTLRGFLQRVPAPKPLLPDPGVQFQLVHHDDVAAALRAGVLGKGAPGAYNLAGPGQLTITDVAHELGWHAVAVPRLAVEVGAEVLARLPALPDEASWIEALRRPVLMDASRARRELRWHPRHDAAETLRETVIAWQNRNFVSPPA